MGMNESNVLKVGIVGAGFIVKKSHIPGLAATSKCYIAGLHDINEVAAREARKFYLDQMEQGDNPLLSKAKNGCNIHDSLEELVKSVDIVDIATPPAYHLEAVSLALNHGKHVICEKPLARNWQELLQYPEIMEKAAGGDWKFQLHTQGIWHPIVKAGRDLIADGVVGEIQQIRTLHQGADPKHTVKLASLWDKHHSGGGALMDIGPHAYAGMWYWLDAGWEPVAVETQLLEATVPVREIAGKPGTKVTVEDDAHVTITWKNKDGREIRGDLEASWNKKDWHEGKVGSRLAPDLYYEITGTKGILTFPNVMLSFRKPFGIAAGLKFKGKKGEKHAYKFKLPKKGIEDLNFFDEFIDVIKGERKGRNDFKFAEEMLLVFGAAYLSSKSGKKVTLKEYKKYAENFKETPALIDDLFSSF
ncbi:hypothetical protein GF325_10415 [Candidatus Bathyarchaeota archaeon]|nr:hypothetical protein [Candidatus Bathyarchaeota archaeon]